MSTQMLDQTTTQRSIAAITRGHSHGPITRLMSPSDFGQLLKPFVFLDLFEMETQTMSQMGIHPHSGIATVTVLTEGDVHYNDKVGHEGYMGVGGVEWMRAGTGIWHGDEMSQGKSKRIQGFQLWVALDAELELSSSFTQFVESDQTPAVGPARVMIGSYAGVTSPARSPQNMTYLLVTLAPNERWQFVPEPKQSTAFIAVAKGDLDANGAITAGDLAAFEDSTDPIDIQAGAQGATFVLGSAIPHPYPLSLGYYSVHTSPEALAIGEAEILRIRPF
ncbi:pirin family protein [Saccharospirillum mangrovi]|uniref:pirin family protein n=1 Tax=Saccharospirillum mangrovi TaxID=2161747 RepID=UPI000D3A3A86|nr:pirin family protein [Saccharospirillum mangrovi]